MQETLDLGQFRDLFRSRSIVLTDLPPGRSRQLAEQVNEAVGRGDATLYAPAELRALFGALRQEPDSGPVDGVIALTTPAGGRSTAGRAVDEFLAASIDADGFFAEPMYVVQVEGWPPDQLTPAEPVESPPGARLRVWRTDPHDSRHLPPAGPPGVLFSSAGFSMTNSGNRTKYVPKRSWKIDLDPGEEEDRVAGMTRLNLKAMWNDPSQLREGLTWSLFGTAGVPAPRSTFAKLALNGRYKGIFCVVQEVDRRFLRQHFGANDRGNLYKMYCGDLGCATLEHRTGPQGDGGAAYISPARDDQTYRLRTNEDDPAANTYDDLAELIRVINHVGSPGGPERFDTDAFRARVEGVFNARAFLRWAGVNVLLGSWDNYFATPANYFLYNSGRRGADRDFVASPFFTFIPWDYDNSLGIDYFGATWQDTDLVDWPSATRPYWAKQGSDRLSRIPLVQNLFANHHFLQYYLDHLEFLLDTRFTPDAIGARLGVTGRGDGLWQRVSQAAYLESDTPHGHPFTGRQFSNDEVYRSGFAQEHLHRGEASIHGILTYVRMRYDSARAQLAKLRARYPSGASGAAFPAAEEGLPT
jgi:hypothetical protein